MRAPGTPFGVHGVDVGDPDVEEAADPIGVARRLEGDRGLVVGGASATLMMMKLLASCDIGRLRTEDHRAAEYLGIEAPGALDVVGDDEVAHHHSQCGLRGFGHWHLHSRRERHCYRLGSRTLGFRSCSGRLLRGNVSHDEGRSSIMGACPTSRRRALACRKSGRSSLAAAGVTALILVVAALTNPDATRGWLFWLLWIGVPPIASVAFSPWPSTAGAISQVPARRPVAVYWILFIIYTVRAAPLYLIGVLLQTTAWFLSRPRRPARDLCEGVTKPEPS